MKLETIELELKFNDIFVIASSFKDGGKTLAEDRFSSMMRDLKPSRMDWLRTIIIEQRPFTFVLNTYHWLTDSRSDKNWYWTIREHDEWITTFDQICLEHPHRTVRLRVD